MSESVKQFRERIEQELLRMAPDDPYHDPPIKDDQWDAYYAALDRARALITDKIKSWTDFNPDS